MRIINAIKWFFNHPPIGITAMTEIIPCSYCGGEDGSLTQFVDADFVICQSCLKKALNKVLLVDLTDQESA